MAHMLTGNCDFLSIMLKHPGKLLHHSLGRDCLEWSSLLACRYKYRCKL